MMVAVWCSDLKAQACIPSFFLPQTHELLAKLLGADNPDVRAAAVFTLGALIQATDSGGLGGLAGLGGSSGALAGAAASAASLSPVSSAAGSMPGPAGAGPEAAAAAGAAPAAAEGPLPEADRLAIERAIACALLEVVYDASPTVRWVWAGTTAG